VQDEDEDVERVVVEITDIRGWMLRKRKTEAALFSILSSSILQYGNSSV